MDNRIDMKTKLLIGMLFLLLGILPLRAQSERTDTVSVSYQMITLQADSLPDPHIFPDAFCFDVTVKAPQPSLSYTLYLVHSVGGEEEREAVGEGALQGQDGMTKFCFFAQTLSADTVCLYCQPLDKKWYIPMKTAYCILMETRPKQAYVLADRIPLIAYTPGHEEEFEWEGRKASRVDFCGVRDALLHPSSWHKAFDIQDYLYFELVFNVP